MDNKPISREKKVIEGTGKIGRQGTGLGSGPVGNRNGKTGLDAQNESKTKGLPRKGEPGTGP
ncbi:MAG: hypothetical protein MJ092_07905 [Lachnospiraceae bacterium]|nr:hypothetical protein [Lachnospiraceae bacterium]